MNIKCNIYIYIYNVCMYIYIYTNTKITLVALIFATFYFLRNLLEGFGSSFRNSRTFSFHYSLQREEIHLFR